ncbi:hypothetical protein A2Z23_01440 [Candidatus Curtissbacteria bacterium RBG_16_39_7]|uniref:Uncharacterized protein n=1 Tax=Candidatus Curtissbacteria bacterium RBG_16_39_7 TaxID=1797707 RepID=A0A1F5G4Y2_9BACT|nr:MAG: hypothetical protein A2Z23_01440 [Candidatus Curtissbacteria bacterium RBG_16_39_7]
MKLDQVTWYSKLLAAILFVALPFVGFCLGMKYQQAITISQKVPANSIPKTGDTNIAIKADQLTLKTTYENGFLKYSGEVELPSPCHQLKDQSLVMESYPEQVQIRLMVESPQPGVACVQVITDKEFSGQIKVSDKATVSVHLNGQKVK